MNVCLHEHSADCLCCHIKGKAKQATELVKVQSVLCKDVVCLKRDLLYKDLLNNCLVIVIVYEKGCNKQRNNKEKQLLLFTLMLFSFLPKNVHFI